jgi:hypothetical protein
LNNVTQDNIKSETLKLNNFYLSKVCPTLFPQSIYTFILNVTASASKNYQAISTYESITVLVSSGDIKAIITDGSNRLITPNAPLILDASLSYDENDHKNTNLQFLWSCIYRQFDELYGSSCNNAVFGSNEVPNTIIVSVDPSVFVPNNTYGFSVQVVGTNDRSAISYPEVLARISNLVSETSVIITSYIHRANLNQTLNIFATLSSKSSYGLDAEWSAYIDGIELPSDSWTTYSNKMTTFLQSDFLDLSGQQQQDLSNQKREFSLSTPLSDNIFVAGSIVTFRLSAASINIKGIKYSTNLGYSELQIYLNSPPYGGKFKCFPDTGYALSTPFILKVSDWMDIEDDYPLTYDFTYQLDKTSSSQIIHSRSILNLIQAEFTSGYQGSNYIIVLSYFKASSKFLRMT